MPIYSFSIEFLSSDFSCRVFGVISCKLHKLGFVLQHNSFLWSKQSVHINAFHFKKFYFSFYANCIVCQTSIRVNHMVARIIITMKLCPTVPPIILSISFHFLDSDPRYSVLPLWHIKIAIVYTDALRFIKNKHLIAFTKFKHLLSFEFFYLF